MTAPATLGLGSVIDVTVTAGAGAAPRSSFNEGLIVGSTVAISVADRIKKYEASSWQTSMVNDGFVSTDPEYIAAGLYFGDPSVQPAPNVLWVGMQDLTALGNLAVNAGGEGYAVNNVLSIVQGGASGGTAKVTAVINGELKTVALHAAGGGSGYAGNDTVSVAGGTGGTLKVLTVDGGGAVETFEILAPGHGYATGNNVATTAQVGIGAGFTVDISAIANGVVSTISRVSRGTGYAIGNGNATTVAPAGGAGCTIDISTVGETLAEAIQECRNINFDFWGVNAPQAVKADHEAIAAAVSAMTPTTFYFYNTADADALSGAADNVFSHIKALSYNRNAGIYATDQAAVYPNNNYAGAAMMGMVMGLNTGLANSAFTAKFKKLTGIATEPLSTSSVAIIEGNGGNLYLSYGNFYKWLEQGITGDGSTFIDQVLFRDMLANYIQLNIADLFNQTVKVPQTRDGVTMIIRACKQACQTMATIGYLGAGTWRKAPVMNLSTGDPMPSGFIIQAPDISTLSDADMQLRKMPPVYICVNEAGAAHSVAIQVNVNL